MPTIRAALLPDHLASFQLSGAVAVVIDVLRATTTISHALEHGALCILPVASIDSARMIAHDRTGTLLCGERGGIKPEGFSLGNSPAEYTLDSVGGRELVLTTTNGTRALHMCDDAHEILTASITNLDAIARELTRRENDIVLVCSGTDGRFSLEDGIAAGLLAEAIGSSHSLDDSAAMMCDAAIGAIERCAGLEPAIASSYHAQRLIGLGFGDDVRFASQRSTCDIVPCFDAATGEIRAIEQPHAAQG